MEMQNLKPTRPWQDKVGDARSGQGSVGSVCSLQHATEAGQELLRQSAFDLVWEWGDGSVVG